MAQDPDEKNITVPNTSRAPVKVKGALPLDAQTQIHDNPGLAEDLFPFPIKTAADINNLPKEDFFFHVPMPDGTKEKFSVPTPKWSQRRKM